MAGNGLEAEFRGWKKSLGFRSLHELRPEDFYPPGQSNPKTDRIIEAAVRVLRPAQGKIGGY